MRVSVETFWLPKAGNSLEEYEDAYWPREPICNEATNTFRCAVADGATETSFSALWAGQLVREYCRGRTGPARFFRSLPALRQEWLRQVTARPLPWYAEDKVRSGAYAAFLGLTLETTPSGKDPFARWSALAVGDCALFQVRQGRVRLAFPFTHSRQFNSRPYLLGSRAAQRTDLDANVHVWKGECEPGDRFYLLTDALACWLLSRQEVDLTGAISEEAEEAPPFDLARAEEGPHPSFYPARGQEDEWIKQRAAEAGLSQRLLAERLGVSPSLLYQYTRGILSPPLEFLQRVAQETSTGARGAAPVPRVDYLAGIRAQEDFEAFVQAQRALRDAERRPLLRNDDVTLLRIDIT